MRRNILLIGSDSFLAAAIAARELAHDDTVSILRIQQDDEDSTEAFPRLAAKQFARLAPEKASESIWLEVTSRLQVVVQNDGQPAPDELKVSAADKAWYFLPSQRNFTARNRDLFLQFLTALSILGVREFNLVLTAYANDANPGETPWISESELADQCRRRNIAFRIFHTSLIVGEEPHLRDHDLIHFLDALYDLKQEIKGHLADYFNFEVLRCPAPEDAALNLMRAEDAADLMANLSWREETSNRGYDIASPENTAFSDLCDRIESAYDVGISATQSAEELTAMDLLFRERTKVFQEHLSSVQRFDWAEAYAAAGWAGDKGAMDESAQTEIFAAIHQRKSDARLLRETRVASLPERLNRKCIDRNGFNLTYFTTGSGGTPILILNAMGQGLFYWYPLIDILMHRHRIVAWEPRGTVSPPQPFGLNEQVEDVGAILREEGIRKCHLLAWCTGPKVAVECYLRFPDAIQSMVFVNSQFKTADTAHDLTTKYERRIESLFRVLEKNPETAGAVRDALLLNLKGEKINLFDRNDSHALAIEVLSMMNESLKPHVLAPFENEATTLAYGRQLLDFWSYDTLAKARRVDAPILLITAEYDKIAAPAMSRAALNHFPRATYREIQHGAHYCFFERPTSFATLMKEFFETVDAPAKLTSGAGC